MSTAAQIIANRANAQKSTGPTTAEGKTISSQNHTRHGFRGKFLMLGQESGAEFSSLFNDLMDEHQPASVTEKLLVQRMAEHLWLVRRAQNMQTGLLADSKAPLKPFNTEFSLYQRYETSNDRAFHKCLSALLKLKAEQRKAQADQAKLEIGFERQKQAQANEQRKQEAHAAKVKLTNAKTRATELAPDVKEDVKEMVQPPLPGHATFTLDELKPLLTHALRELAAEKGQKAAA